MQPNPRSLGERFSRPLKAKCSLVGKSVLRIGRGRAFCPTNQTASDSVARDARADQGSASVQGDVETPRTRPGGQARRASVTWPRRSRRRSAASIDASATTVSGARQKARAAGGLSPRCCAKARVSVSRPRARPRASLAWTAMRRFPAATRRALMTPKPRLEFRAPSLLRGRQVRFSTGRKAGPTRERPYRAAAAGTCFPCRRSGSCTTWASGEKDLDHELVQSPRSAGTPPHPAASPLTGVPSVPQLGGNVPAPAPHSAPVDSGNTPSR